MLKIIIQKKNSIFTVKNYLPWVITGYLPGTIRRNMGDFIFTKKIKFSKKWELYPRLTG